MISYFKRLGFWPLILSAVLAGCANNTQTTMPISTTTLNVADAAMAGGNPAMALKVSQAVLEGNPTSTDALIHEGDALYALDRCPEAIAAYNAALKINPQSSLAETGLGRCLIKTDPKQADAALFAAVTDDRQNAAAYNDLGVARDLEGQFSAAVQPFRDALAIAPDMISAKVNLGLSLALSGDPQQAIQILEPMARGSDATPKIREDYAAALAIAGETDQASQVLSIDMPPDQINSALNGYQALAAGAMPPIPDAPAATASPAAGAPPATVAALPTSNIQATILPPVSQSPIPQPSSSMPPATITAQAAPAAAPPVRATTTVATVETTATKTTPMKAANMPASQAAPASAEGNVMVQLAALNSQSQAQAAWDSASRKMPSLLADRSPDIQTAQIGDRTFYRLRTGGFASRAAAAQFCSKIQAAGGTCAVANF